MTKKIKTAAPIAASIILSLSTIAGAWAVQDAAINGINVTSSEGGVKLLLGKIGGSYAETASLEMSAELKPCAYTSGRWYDQSGLDVTDNDAYVKTYSLLIMAEEACEVEAYINTSGDLPVKVMINAVEASEEKSNVLSIKRGDVAYELKIQIWVDGESYEKAASANVAIYLHGE